MLSNTDSMFEATVSKLVKTVGHESLVGVPSLDQSDYCRPLQVVVKKNRRCLCWCLRWYWQSAKYEPTPFQLHQLLADPEPDLVEGHPGVKVTNRKLTTYNRTHSFSLKGKIGSKLKALLDAELDGSDSVDIEAKLGDITKDEVDQPALMESLKTKHVDLKHEFISQVRQNWRKTLCVIVGVVKTTADSSIHMKTDIKGEEKLEPEGIVKTVVDPSEDATVDDANDKTLVVPAQTPLGYSVCEIYVKSDGSTELIIESDCRGGFEDGGPEPDSDDVDALVSKAYSSLEDDYRALSDLPREERSRLSHHVLHLCEQPQAVLETFMVMKRASRTSEGSERMDHVSEDVKEDVIFILQQAGFVVKDDLEVEYPKESNPLGGALLCMFEAIMELDDDETVALGKCDGTLDLQLLALLSEAVEGKSVKTTDKSVEALFASPNKHQEFITTLGFEISDGNTIVAADDNPRELEGALRAVWALWWDNTKPRKSSSNCVIL